MHRALVLIVLCLGLIEGRLCPSIDVRNTPSSLEQLTNCTTIVGSLYIVLIEVDDGKVFEKYSFPDLVEIVEYVIVSQVNQLTSLGQLFPNLRIIRGYKLFSNFALILYDNANLKEVGLKNLVRIERGSVIVDKCPNICYVNTIDWRTLGATNLNFSATKTDCPSQSCRKDCGGFCWNSQQCQRSISENQCHSQCIGCTKSHSARDCLVCRRFESKGICRETCPANTYPDVSTMKCWEKQECLTMLNQTYFIFNNSCVNECPRYHVKKGKSCVDLGENYTKVCEGPVIINTLEALENTSLCTHIKGSLELTISQNEYVLERHLGAIVSISGFLKIGRSYDIISLDFFRKLREIKGEKLYSKQYALFVYENRNLQRLWNFTNTPLVIRNGTVAFHDNPQLCIDEIVDFINVTKLTGKMTLNLYKISNGYRARCNARELFKAEVVLKGPKSVKLEWKHPPIEADESIIGYTVFYIPSKRYDKDDFSDVPPIETGDSCRVNSWESTFVRNNSVELLGLIPYQRYYYYIKTYTTLNNGHETPMDVFNTTSGDPSDIQNVLTEATSFTSIAITWKPPLRSNGNLSFYKIVIYTQEDYLPDRNFCSHPHDFDVEEPITTTISTKNLDNCTCATEEKIKIFKENLVCINSFDEKCQPYIYNIENLDKTKRDVARFSNESGEEIQTAGGSGPNKYYEFKNLKPFTLYIFYIKACNSRDDGESYDRCGPAEMVTRRTRKNPDFDVIKDVAIVVDDRTARVNWREPKETNSYLVSYQIEYKRSDIQNSKPIPECLTRVQYQERGLELHLAPGKYMIRVKAVSLAGPGRVSPWRRFTILAPNTALNWLWAFLVAFLLIVLLLAFLVVRYRYRRKRALDSNHLITSVNPEYAGLSYEEDEWELDRSDIEIVKELGQGSFGMVYQGVIKSKRCSCAIKTVNKSATIPNRVEFLHEGSVMKSFNNAHHVVKLLGIVSRGQPPLVVMELMERGDLKSFLRRCREPSQNVTTNELYRMAAEIADGMSYLSAKKFVHRDLAARNCMVAADHTVKIGDFGMARDVYETDYYRKETVGLLPVRWMAPESLIDGVFTSDSDVWSYGVVLWEMATLAEQPYQGLTNQEVLGFISKNAGKLQRPKECSDLLFEVMDACWKWHPNKRPTFADIVSKLSGHVGEAFRLVSFYHSRQSMEMALNSGPRTYNAPAMTAVPEQDECFSQYDPINEEVSLHVKNSRTPRFLPFANQRFSKPASYQMSPSSPSSAFSLSSS